MLQSCTGERQIPQRLSVKPTPGQLLTYRQTCNSLLSYIDCLVVWTMQPSMVGGKPVYRRLAGEFCTPGTGSTRGYYVSLYFRVWLRLQESGREEKGHKEAKKDLEIVGQYRLTMQAELKATGKTGVWPSSAQVHFHGLPGAIKKLVWQASLGHITRIKALERCILPIDT